MNMSKEPTNKAKDFEKALKDKQNLKYVLHLYVTGTTPKSARAIRNIRKICDEYLRGRCELDVIDVYQQPGIARQEDITVTPTLVKALPSPLRKLIGDLSDTEHVLVGLNLTPKESD